MPYPYPSSGYFQDLLDQPRALRATLDGLSGQSLPADLTGRLARSDFRRVVLTGMGSSFHALHPLFGSFVRRGVDAVMVETSELLHGLDGLLRPGTLVVAVSQSGRSAEIVSLLERRRDGVTVLGVTNTTGSPLDLLSDGRVLTNAGEEMTVSCKTYLATLAALAWLDAALAGEAASSVLAALSPAADAVETYLAEIHQHVDALMERLRGTGDLFIVGRGASLAAVGTGGLICKEAAHFHSEGMSSAAFRHGPFEMLSQQVFVLVHEGYGEGARLNRRLVEDARQAGGRAALVSETAQEAVFRLPAVTEPARPIVEILPAQMVTLALATLKGHEAGRFSLATKVTAVE